jgi:hypothetical protein
MQTEAVRVDPIHHVVEAAAVGNLDIFQRKLPLNGCPIDSPNGVAITFPHNVVQFPTNDHCNAPAR